MSLIKGNTSEVYIDDKFVIKKQVKFLSFNLIRNEYQKLQYLRLSTHVPKVIFLVDNFTIRLENVGEFVTGKNLPVNWEHQLEEIRRTLRASGILHRDIRPANFTVKDGWLYLIDFGWAVFNSEAQWGPKSIGDAFKDPKGWNDDYSLDMLIVYFRKLKQGK